MNLNTLSRISIVAGLLLSPPLLSAQVAGGTITGTITDTSGSVIPQRRASTSPIARPASLAPSPPTRTASTLRRISFPATIPCRLPRPASPPRPRLSP